MKLLDILTRHVVQFGDQDTPPYVVLSHTWSGREKEKEREEEEEEDNMLPPQQNWATDLQLGKRLAIQDKVLRACDDALARGINHLWVDSLCVDASSSAELQEAVNGAFRRLHQAAVCFAHLDDLLPVEDTAVPEIDETIWRRCRYWTRAWTLQELILPPKVDFFDAGWNHRGSKSSPEISSMLSRITCIPASLLLDANTLGDIALALRLSWMRGRTSSRDEDTAYALAALTGVSMAICYGEGAEPAFLRLQEEILQDTRDGSIFAWCGGADDGIRGLLARSPSEFSHFASLPEACRKPWIFDGKLRFSSRGIHVSAPMENHGSYVIFAIGRMQIQHHAFSNAQRSIGVYLREWQGVYVRVRPASQAVVSTDSHHVQTIDVARHVEGRVTETIRKQFDHVKPLVYGGLWGRSLGNRRVSNNNIGRTIDTTKSILPIRVSSGIKRNSDGLPIRTSSSWTHIGNVPSAHALEDTSLSSDDGGSDNSQSSDSDSDESDDKSESDDGETHHKESAAVEDYYLAAKHALGRCGPGLAKFSYAEFKKWMASAWYDVPPDDRLPPRKRSRLSYEQRKTRVENDEDDPELVVVSQLDGYFHLACPFYVYDAKAHMQCLIQHDLQSVEDVMQHLRQHHKQPQHCPICYQIFDRTLDRDQHIRARVCMQESPREVDGVTESIMAKLIKRDKLYLGEAKRWLRLWDTLFPEAKPGRSPYLQHERERAVSMARDYWHNHGRRSVSRYLESCSDIGGQVANNRRVLAELANLVWDDLLMLVLEECTPK